MHLPLILFLVAFVCTGRVSGDEVHFNTSSSSPSHLSAASTAATHHSLNISIPPPDVIQCDPYCCNCNGPKARCTGQHRRWQYLPRLPATIRDFRMMRAKLPNMTRSMLANLSNFDLTVMNLTFNQISYIEPGTFADFVKMESLDLSGNPIPMLQLKATLKGITSTSVHTLTLNKMGLTFIPDDFFDMFFNKTFRKVDLKQNHLRSFNNAIFAVFWSVRIVDLCQNEISEVNMTARINTRRLILKENSFQHFPDFCLHHSPTTGEAGYFRAFYHLHSIYIANNPFKRIHPGVLRGTCLPLLKKLDISWSTTLKTLENNFVADLPQLRHLMVNYMTNLDRYEPYAFNSSSLKILTLDQNRNLGKDVVDIQHVFRYCPNLESLSIVNTKLIMDEKELRVLLLQLQSVTHLNIQRVRRGTIPEGVLWRLPRLQKFHFTGNNLNSDGLARALVNVTNLKQLNVQANSITVVNETTLPWEFRRHVDWLDISQNPFTCTCELLWFRKWLDDVQRNKSVTVNNFLTSQYRCNTPASMKGVRLADFHLTEEMCAVRNPYVLIAGVGSCLLAGLVLVAAVGYRYRWHLRFYVYRLRRHHEYRQVPSGLVNEDGREIKLFTYDAYLAHSTKDLDWIMTELLDFLEKERGLKVFLEERDSRAGAVIMDNINKYMDESARVLLLISDNYIREGWRQYEFELIICAAIEQQKDIIVLLLGDVEAGRMTKDMRRMLTRGTFLQWGSSEEARKAFRDGLIVALKTQDVNCLSMC